MPPDDDLFATPPEGSPAPKGNGGAASSAADEGKPLSEEGVLRIVKDFVEPNTEMMDRLTRNQQELANTVSEVRNVLERLGVAGGGSKETEGDEGFDMSRLLTDPDAIPKMVERSAGEFFKKEIAPILSQQIESTHRQTVSGLKADIDAKYGTGAWEEHFAPELNPLFDRTRREAPSRLGDSEAIRKAVEVIKGEKFDTLMAAQAKAAEDRKAAREQEMNETREYVTSNLSGGIGVRKETSSLSDEGKAFLSKIFEATGERQDEKEFLVALNSGSSYDEWLAARKKAGL